MQKRLQKIEDDLCRALCDADRLSGEMAHDAAVPETARLKFSVARSSIVQAARQLSQAVKMLEQLQNERETNEQQTDA